MPRRGSNNTNGTTKRDFRFEWVNYSEKMLDELRGWIANNEDSLEETLLDLMEAGWKLSISENHQTGRMVASITDKAGRKGCDNACWGIEHSNVTSAILGAAYYAIEVIGDGMPENERGNVVDTW